MLRVFRLERLRYETHHQGISVITKERGELDAVLPDLLSELGLNVYSRPGRGTRQDGVDVGAVGSLDGGSEKVSISSRSSQAI